MQQFWISQNLWIWIVQGSCSIVFPMAPPLHDLCQPFFELFLNTVLLVRECFSYFPIVKLHVLIPSAIDMPNGHIKLVFSGF